MRVIKFSIFFFIGVIAISFLLLSFYIYINTIGLQCQTKTYCFRLDNCDIYLTEWLRAKDLVVGLLLLIEEDPDQDTTQSLQLVLQYY